MGILDLMGYVQKQGEAGRERGQQSYLGKLAGQAYGAAPDQQRGIVQQAITTNPDAGFSLASALGKTQDRDFSQLGQAAAIFSTIPDEQKQEFYATKLAPLAKQAGYPVPETYDPRFQQAIDKIAQIGGGGGQGDELKSLRIGANGNYWAIRGGQFVDTGTPAAPTNQVIDTGNGFFGVDKRTLNAAPVVVGGQQPQQQRAPGEVPFSIDPSLPPQVQASIRANESAFAAVPDGGQVQIGPQGGGEQLRSVPKPSAPVASYAPLSADEVQQMGLPAGTVAQRNTSTGELKIVNRPPQQANSNGGVNSQKLAQANATKMAQFNTIERGIERLETAAGEISKNKLFDGGPLDKYVLKSLPQGQELEQAAASILPVLTALTRVPGVGAQSDLESRLATLQMPSAEFPPEVNRRAVSALRAYIRDLKSAYENVGATEQPQTSAVAGDDDALIGKYL